MWVAEMVRGAESGDAGAAHAPVMVKRITELLLGAFTTETRQPVVVDATLGLGGHTEAILQAHPSVRVLGIDRDPEALQRASERLARFGERFTGVRARFDEIADVLADAGLPHADAVLFDLGVSSMQLDKADRGFAYSVDAPLDMRMDGSPTSDEVTAAHVLATYSHAELARVLRTYGEEKFASKIASAIVRRRETSPLQRSGELVELLYAEIPAPARRTGGHPAKRTFQALRMEVNDELGVLRRALPAAIDVVAVGGRVVVEAYHSGEDRLVKRAFTSVCTSTAPPDLPVVPPELKPTHKSITRGAERASEVEMAANPRAASVRLRAIERIRTADSTRAGVTR